MKPHDFGIDRFTRPGKYRELLDFDVPGEHIDLPLLLVRGAREGKTLVITAGVHGDEYEGVLTVYQTHRELDPTELDGN